MIKYKAVSISKLSFAFCRYSVAILVWSAFFLHSKLLLIILGFIFLLSAIFKVQRAIMIVLADLTLGKIWKSSQVLVNEYALFFAHLVGLFFSLVCLAVVYYSSNPLSWYSVGIFALLKSVSAIGFCPATKLYECMFNGTCCVNSKEIKCTDIR
jgi:hypothetical protein